MLTSSTPFERIEVPGTGVRREKQVSPEDGFISTWVEMFALRVCPTCAAVTLDTDEAETKHRRSHTSSMLGLS